MADNPGPDARFAIIEIPPGPSPPEAIVVGNMDAVMRCLPQTVASEEQEQRLKEDAQQLVADRVTHLIRQLDHVTNRVGVFESRKRAYEAHQKERADQLQRAKEEAEAAAAEAEANAEYSLPYPEAPDVQSVIDATHQPTGDLHAVGPVDAEHLDPEGEARSEALSGDMPKQLERGAPPPPGDYLETTPPESPYRNPTSIGLN